MLIETTIPEETAQEGAKLAKYCQDKTGVILLKGDLGAGKTTFVQGFAKGLEINDSILSPTFVLIRQYPFNSHQNTLYHVDLYRMEDKLDLKSLGLTDIIDDPTGLVLIEWPEKLISQPPKILAEVIIKKIGEQKRQIEIQLKDYLIFAILRRR